MTKRIVNVTIDTKSANTKNKIYQYTTEDKNIKAGDQIRIKVPSGGTPNATVIDDNVKKSSNLKLKRLDIKK